MNIRTLNQFGLMLLSGLCFTGAAGAFEGEYTYSGYEVSFLDSTNTSWGLTKDIYAEFSDISISPSNTFTSAATKWTLNRSVFDIWESGSEDRLVNYYSTSLSTNSSMDGGTLTPGLNVVLTVDLGDGDETPLYFNTSTNVALMIHHTDEDDDALAKAGLGILVRKGSGMNNASLNGDYVRYTLGNAAYGSTPNGWGNIDRISLEDAILTFNGSGSYTEDVFEWTLDREITEVIVTNGADTYVDSFGVLSAATENAFTTSGTYSVLSDGTLLIPSGAGIITNRLSPDGNLAVSTFGIGDGTFAGAYFNVVIKLPGSMSTAPVSTSYFIVEVEDEFSGTSPTAGANENYIEVGRTYVFLNSDSTFSIRSDWWGADNLIDNVRFDAGTPNIVSINQFSTFDQERLTEFASGTYSISSDGGLTLFFDNGDEDTAQLSENGEYIVFGAGDSDGTSGGRFNGIGVRRNPPPPAPGPIFFNDDIDMTSTGLVMTATVPANYPIEGVATTNLVNNEWFSGGAYTSATGTVTIHDPEATNSATTFYRATFVPW